MNGCNLCRYSYYCEHTETECPEKEISLRIIKDRVIDGFCDQCRYRANCDLTVKACKAFLREDVYSRLKEYFISKGGR